MNSNQISWDDFEKVEMRVGTIKKVEDFYKAKKSAYIITVDFGDFGVRRSSAQITKLYEKKVLIGKQIIAVTNFPPKQIANFMSEFLILGVIGQDKEVILLQPERKTLNGLRVL